MEDQQRAELAEALAEAETFEGWAAEGPSLKTGERVYAELGSAALVEGLDLGVIDHGSVVVTDRRVLFHGATKNREWAFAKLVGYQHVDDGPATLVEVTNRRRISGVRYLDADTVVFRRRLAIAVARVSGSIDALIGSLRSELAAADARVAPPAPPLARRSFRAWPRWAQIGAPALVLMLLIGALSSPPEDDPDTVQVAVERTKTSESIIPTTEATTITTAAPAPSTTTTVAPTTTATTAPPPPTTTTPPTTAPPPPPPPPTVAFVAPAPAPAAGNGCHPSYDPCLPITSDVDCGGGSGNGPAYTNGSVRVIGPDEYDLDRDGDGTGCDN